MTPPINIDGTQITGATIDGQDVSKITVDGTTVFTTATVSRWAYEDDTDTTTALDSVGSNDGTINGPTYTTNSEIGTRALDFDNSGSPDDNVNCGSDASLNLTDEWSWSVRAFTGSYNNPDDSSDIRLLSKRGSNAGPELLTDGGSPPSLRFINGDASIDIVGSSDLPTNSYFMATVTYSVANDRVRIYFNDVQDAQATGISSLSDHGAIDFVHGARQAGTDFGWGGVLDDVKVFSKELSATEVSNLNSTGSI